MGERGPKGKYGHISCPNEACSLYALTERDNIVSRGTYETRSGDVVRKFQCTRCDRVFNSRTGTAYEGIHCSEKDFNDAVNCLTEGAGIRGTGRIVGHTKDTVQSWCARAGRQCAAVNDALEDDMDPSYIQFDELTATVKKNHRE